MNEQVQTPQDPTQPQAAAPPSGIAHIRPGLINWSAFLFAVLQSACSAFMALSGVRLLIGVGAFALASTALKFADRIHIAAIRVPMMILALAGSIVNLVILWQVWRLRRRPASAWRRQPIPMGKIASERFQFALAVLTLLLLVAEFFAHRMLFGNR